MEIFTKWEMLLKSKCESCESIIVDRLLKAQRRLKQEARTDTLKNDWEYISALSPQFKLEANIGLSIVDLELRLWEKVHNPQGKQDQGESILGKQIRENLLNAQENNEFIRRMFIQIAALGMAMGSIAPTANETQKQLVQSDAVSQEKLKVSETERIAQTAAQKTPQSLSGAQAAEGVDTISAIEDETAIQLQKSSSGIEATVGEEAQIKNRIDSWELTRLIGVHPWPPQQLENYLRGVQHSGHHLKITHNYQQVSFTYAATLLKQRIVANLTELPGETALRKKIHQRVFFDYVNSAAKADSSFAERIFSYTPNF